MEGKNLGTIREKIHEQELTIADIVIIIRVRVNKIPQITYCKFDTTSTMSLLTTYLSTIMSKGICDVATLAHMRKSTTMKGMKVLHGM